MRALASREFLFWANVAFLDVGLEPILECLVDTRLVLRFHLQLDTEIRECPPWP